MKRVWQQTFALLLVLGLVVGATALSATPRPTSPALQPASAAGGQVASGALLLLRRRRADASANASANVSASASQELLKVADDGLVLRQPQIQQAVVVSLSTAADNVSLSTAADNLASALDLVTAGVADVKGVVAAITTVCRRAVTTFAGRANTRDSDVSNLQTLRSQSLATQARVQAELDRLTTMETDAQSSFDATVAQRAAEATSFGEENGATIKQAQLLSDVLVKLREKQAVLTSSHTVAGATQPTSAKAGDSFIFLKTSDYDYPAGCANNAAVVVKKVDNLNDPAVQVEWDGGFIFWVKWVDLRTIMPVTSSSGELDSVIGVFTVMLDSANSSQGIDAKEHSEKDLQLMGLVKSYQDSLLHIDSEYQTKNANRSTAKATAVDAKQEAGLHGSVSTEEQNLLSALQDLCGFAGEASLTGEVTIITKRSEQLLSSFTTKVEQTLLTINAIVAKDSTVLVQVVRSPQPQSKAAKWIADARARGLKPLARKRGGARLPGWPAKHDPNLDPPPSAPAPAAAPVRLQGAHLQGSVPGSAALHAVLPLPPSASIAPLHLHVAPAPLASQPVRSRPHLAGPSRAELSGALRKLAKALPGSGGSLADDVKVLNALVHNSGGGGTLGDAAAGQEPASGMSAAMQSCVEEKQSLTAQIVSTRRAARTERSTLAMAEVRMQSLPRWVELLQVSIDLVGQSKAAMLQAYKPLMAMADTHSFTRAIDSALAKVAVAEANITSYMAGDTAGPEAAGLPDAMVDIKADLFKFKQDIPNDLEALYNDGSTITLKSEGLVTRLGNAQGVLETVAGVTEALLKSSAQKLQQLEKTEQDLMSQRMALESSCEATLVSAASGAGLLALRASLQPGATAAVNAAAPARRVI